MKIDDIFHGISTLVISFYHRQPILGTGFFYQELSPKDSAKNEQWRKIENLWLVTNRYILFPKIYKQELIPDKFQFHLRKIVDGAIIWDALELDRTELVKRAKFHTNKNIDVGIVRVLDLINDKLKGGDKYLAYYGVDKEKLPFAPNKSIDVEVGDDVLVIGYPRSVYDQSNVYPIVKSGIIASR